MLQPESVQKILKAALRNGADLAEWIMEDKLPVRLQVQLHKVLWGDQPGR